MFQLSQIQSTVTKSFLFITSPECQIIYHSKRELRQEETSLEHFACV